MKEVAVALHFDQPPIDKAQRVAIESCIPLARMKVLERVTFCLSPTLEPTLEKIDPQAAAIMREDMKATGIAAPFVDTLLPELSLQDRKIVIGAGVKRFIDITGKRPRFFWPPGTAIDNATLQVLAEQEIEAFFCSPRQVILYDGRDANNMPTQIMLNTGTIIAMPYDLGFSQKLAREEYPDQPLRADAGTFAEKVVIPALSELRNGCPLIGCAPGQTFGYLMQWGGAFAKSLVYDALPEKGITPIAVNSIDFKEITVARGKIRERTASNCLDGNLTRLHSELRRKLNSALTFLNAGITSIVAWELGQEYERKMIDHFEEAFRDDGLTPTTEMSLIKSKVDALMALSDNTSFVDDSLVSINPILHNARVAAGRLNDAGLGFQAKEIWKNFLDLIKEIPDPTKPGETGCNIILDLLDERTNLNN